MKQILSLILSMILMLYLCGSPAAAVGEDMTLSKDEVNAGDMDAALNEENDSADEGENSVLEIAVENMELTEEEGKLENTGDRQSYKFKVDHSVTGDIAIFVQISGDNPGQLIAMLSDTAGGSYSAKPIYGIPRCTTDMVNCPKDFWTISNQSYDTVTYTVSLLAQTDNISYKVALGTMNDINMALGGLDNMAPAAKNVASDMAVGYIQSYVTLLNGDGDWYRYKATTGETYVGLRSNYHSSLAFQIYDAETGKLIGESNTEDVYTNQITNTFYEYTVQKRYDLTPGHEYYIKMYSTKPCVPDDPAEKYDVIIGYPGIDPLMVRYTSPSSYSISANRLTTFRINVTEISKLVRANNGFIVAFNTTSSANNSMIKSGTVIAPNGRSFSFSSGGKCYLKDIPFDFENFLTNSQNIPLAGTWTIMVESSGSLSGLKLRLTGSTYHVSCNEPQ